MIRAGKPDIGRLPNFTTGGMATMVIARWDPLRDLEELQDRLNRLFQGTVSRTETRERTWAPVVDVYEDDDSIVLQAELPGISREEIEIEVTHESLTIRGERKFVPNEKRSYVRIERPYGPFARTFAVNTPIDSQHVKATYKEGVLEILVPKAAETKPKKIPVAVE